MTKPAVVALVALLLIDFALIGLHLWRVWAMRGNPAPEWIEWRGLSLEWDGGLAEQVNYVKLSAAAAVLVGMALRDRTAVLAAWALVLVVAVADDALALHEEWGYALASDLTIPEVFGAPERNLGELLVWAGMAAVVLPLLVLAHRSSDRSGRTLSWRLALLLAALTLVAGGVDMLHVRLEDSRLVGPALAVVEDGGEILLSTFIVAVIVAAATAKPVSRAPRAA